MITAGPTNATTVLTPSDREIVTTRVVDAPRRLVFDAWTSAEHLPLWMLGPNGWPMPVCEIDLRPGGRWRFVWRRFDGAEQVTHGAYREVAPLECIVYTEVWSDGPGETLNTVHFAEEDGKTTITLRVRYPTHDARDTALRIGTRSGVVESLDNLAEYLDTMG